MIKTITTINRGRWCRSTPHCFHINWSTAFRAYADLCIHIKPPVFSLYSQFREISRKGQINSFYTSIKSFHYDYLMQDDIMKL